MSKIWQWLSPRRSLCRLLRRPRLVPSARLVVLISGCDSGLGLRAAREACAAGLTVVAGVLDERGERVVRDHCAAHTVRLDITSDASVGEAMQYVEKLLDDNPDYTLHALVNNAGVMVFGEFAWQPLELATHPVAVNLLGTWRLSMAALPLLRRAAAGSGAPRLLVVGSHCALQPLRALAPYAASKAALRAWAEALRMELRPHGVHVVDFIPGSMVTSTNITANQDNFNKVMQDSFTDEQKRYYQDHFRRTSNYLCQISGEKPHNLLNDEVLVRKLMDSLLAVTPAPEYKHQPLRYAVYHFLFKISPMTLRYWLVEKFMTLPAYNKNTELASRQTT